MIFDKNKKKLNDINTCVPEASMDFFSRKKACIYVEIKEDKAKTKKALENKINWIAAQYKNTKDVFLNSKKINCFFVDSMLYAIDLAYKRITALQFLINQEEAEWKILNIFISEGSREFYSGNLKQKMIMLDIDISGDYHNKFFYILKKFGIISSETWYSISLLTFSRNNLSISHINDYAYYTAQKQEIINPEIKEQFTFEEIEEYKNYLIQRYKTLYAFRNNEITYRKINDVSWNFLTKVCEHDYYKILLFVLEKNNFYLEEILKYFEKLSKNKNFDTDLIQQYPEFIENFEDIIKIISELIKILQLINKNIKNFRLLIEEFSLLNCPKTDHLFNSIFYVFLNNKFDIFNEQNPMYLKRTNNEKLLHAEYQVDLILKLLKNGWFFSKIKFPTLVTENFNKLNKIDLSILNDKNLINKILLFNTPQYQELINKIRTASQMKNYNQIVNNPFKEYFDLILSLSKKKKSLK